jgi:hypothetical protein
MYPSIGNFSWIKKKYTFGVKKVKISLQSSKTEFGAQNQYGRVSIVREFYMEREKYKKTVSFTNKINYFQICLFLQFHTALAQRK